MPGARPTYAKDPIWPGWFAVALPCGLLHLGGFELRWGAGRDSASQSTGSRQGAFAPLGNDKPARASTSGKIGRTQLGIMQIILVKSIMMLARRGR